MQETKEINKIPGMLLYVQVQKPVKAYMTAGEDPKPDEWKASIAIADEDFIDSFEEFASEVGAKYSIKKVKTASFEEYYKVAPPEDAGKNVWVLTFRKSTELGKTGKPVPDLYRPRVFEKIGKTMVDVTNTKLPANGSKGIISLEIFHRKNGTASFYLKNILVTSMIEYTKSDSDTEYHSGAEFEDEGVVVANATADSKLKEDKSVAPAAKKAAKEVAKKVQEETDETDDIDEEVPF